MTTRGARSSLIASRLGVSGIAACERCVPSSPSRFLRDRCGEIPHPHQVVDRCGEGKHPADLATPAMPHFPHQPHGLEPAEHLLDPLPFALAQLVTLVPGGARVDTAPALRLVL